ncbi:hypothetical protein COY95_00440, partial [Candidatus Woesearchaeota archaeon CG_4_10_14_0_8_um_filter_47_5]
GTPSLSVHAPGNWAEAQMGGEEKTLSHTSALLLKKALLSLHDVYKTYLPADQELPAGQKLEITMECTHHGPAVEKPCLFIEIGSSEQQWSNKEYGELIARAIIQIFAVELPGQKVAIGLGGTHYCANFNKILLRTDIALSHVCPKHMLAHLDENMLQQAIAKTLEPVDFILLDWKGLGQEKARLVELLEHMQLSWKRVDQLLKA